MIHSQGKGSVEATRGSTYPKWFEQCKVAAVLQWDNTMILSRGAVQWDGATTSRGTMVSALYKGGCGMWDVRCVLGLVKREEK